MKALGWIVGLLVLVIGGAIAYVFFNSGSLVKSAIEEFGPQFLGVDVQVSAVNLDLAQGSAQIKGLSVGNPQGFSGSHMMKLNEIKVVLDTNQISESLVVMKQVVIDGADIVAVAKGQQTNFQKLLDNLESADGGTGGESSEVSSGPETKFIIDSFAFTNATASLSSDVLGELDLNLPDIRLQNIGRQSNGATAAEIAEQLVRPISAAISKEVIRQGIDVDGMKARVEDKLRDKIGRGLRGLTDKLK